MKRIDFAVRAGGFVPVLTNVEIPALVLKHFSQGHERLERLAPSENIADIFYFWMPGCETCSQDLPELQRLQSAEQLKGVLGVRLIVIDALGAEEVVPLLRSQGFSASFWIDSQGALAERLGVLGSPGVVLSDAKFKVVGRMNGSVDFGSAGFEYLVGALGALRHRGFSRGWALQSPVSDEIANDASLRDLLQSSKVYARSHVSFLDITVPGAAMLLCLAVIGYILGKMFVTWLKKFAALRGVRSSSD